MRMNENLLPAKSVAGKRKCDYHSGAANSTSFPRETLENKTQGGERLNGTKNLRHWKD